ncbi:hypothetical protein CC78DRAFT_600228 [Lojkania enalia]|uniref:DUF6594 domain-containing protein n=1 Tax=Lojkania enalia TaxID=147567 RepID=A0A9P4JW67_9PLEO|nr:hypothetical protein CC78DRAFT_600228 [Didymosphaeria enalia]
MESPNEASVRPFSDERHTSWSSDGVSTACGSDLEKRDLESKRNNKEQEFKRLTTFIEGQQIKPINRSLSHYLTLSSPVTSNLDDIEESLEEDGDNKNSTSDLENQRIDDHPSGYPQLAAFLNSDENFLICRKYGLLHSRVLLYRQDELRELEQKLQKMDAAAAKSNGGKGIHSRVRDENESGEWRALIQIIDNKLKEYHDIVQRTRSMASLQPATTRNYNSVCNWIFHTGPIVNAEAETFKKDRDFVALVDAKEGSWFDGAVETALSRFGGPFTRRLFISRRDRSSTKDKLVRLYSKRRIDIFSRLVITILAVILLMAPVIALFSAQESGGIKIMIIFLFTMAFSVALSIFTKAKRHEVFAATAAYCAVLVVFLGNFETPMQLS